MIFSTESGIVLFRLIIVNGSNASGNSFFPCLQCDTGKGQILLNLQLHVSIVNIPIVN
jgi:hypothetical protein